MIIEGVANLGLLLINAIMSVLDVLPNLPASIVNALDSFFDLIFDNSSLIGFFIPLGTVKVLLPLVLIVINFRHIYAGIMWVLRKIPMLNID